nr:hypothetical protein BaRGS_035368 [Batillaria attramentaria]
MRGGQISTGSPCPICRDEYLVLDHKNVKLLEQFVSPYTGEVLESKKTGICQKQHKTLIVEVMKAQDHGFLEKTVPFRKYDYSQYYDEKTGKHSESINGNKRNVFKEGRKRRKFSAIDRQ